MVLILVLVTAVVAVFAAPAERDRLLRRADMLEEAGTAMGRVEAADDRHKAARLDRVALAARVVAVVLGVLTAVEILGPPAAHLFG